jgi:hypothetical protein
MSEEQPARPRPTPCATCPYRKDVPSGVWDRAEYEKLISYDAATGWQPMGVFMCHQADGMVCSGWASVHGTDESLALRLARALPRFRIDVASCITYVSPVELFESGQAAADHGMAEVDAPGERARTAVAKLLRLRGLRRRS